MNTIIEGSTQCSKTTYLPRVKMSTGAQGLVGLVENTKFYEMLILDSGIYAQSSFLLKARNMKDP